MICNIGCGVFAVLRFAIDRVIVLAVLCSIGYGAFAMLRLAISSVILLIGCMVILRFFPQCLYISSNGAPRGTRGALGAAESAPAPGVTCPHPRKHGPRREISWRLGPKLRQTYYLPCKRPKKLSLAVNSTGRASPSPRSHRDRDHD